MRARIAIAALMLLLAGIAVPRGPETGTAAAAPLVAQRGRTPGRPGRGSGGPETDRADARTLLRARVTAVDAATGRIEIAADGVTLGASFPPAVVAEVKPGDVVFVTVSVIDTRLATVTGSIAAVDQAKGTATVTTPGGTLTLTPSGPALGGMKPGDELLLRLGLVDVGPPA
jgi:hypothetical protein